MHDDLSGAFAPAADRTSAGGLSWISVAPGAPYFVDETGAPFTPIGQNDAICWHELDGLFRRRDLDAVEAHLTWLRDSGVTVLRLMMEYAQHRHRYVERPVGRFVPDMVRLWDDLFAMCERLGLRVLLTPVDTFWTWLKWDRHPYNRANGGPLEHPSRLLLCPKARAAIKARLEFAVRRWGGSGALFAWDLWNEIHPAQSEERVDGWGAFIADLSRHVRALELRLYGRSHPQTVSLFGPELRWRPHLDMKPAIFRHPDLDFATIHVYADGAIDDPKTTTAAADAMGAIVRECLAETAPGRPFLDTEHGPIHRYKDKKRPLPEPFDDEYFRHMSWAHLASGGAGGGMRWPNRTPHSLTRGMRAAQKAMSAFLPLIAWERFDRVNLNEEIAVSTRKVSVFGCGDAEQAVVWLMRRDSLGFDGRLDALAPPREVAIRVPGLKPGAARVTAFDTREGRALWTRVAVVEDAGLKLDLEVATDLALVIRR